MPALTRPSAMPLLGVRLLTRLVRGGLQSDYGRRCHKENSIPNVFSALIVRQVVIYQQCREGVSSLSKTPSGIEQVGRYGRFGDSGR